MTIVENEVPLEQPIELSAVKEILIDDSFHIKEVVTITGAHGLHDMYFSFIPTIQPLLMQKLSLNNAQAGLFTLFLQAPSLLQPFIGHLADRRNLRWLLIMAPTLSATVLTLVGLAPNYGILAFLLLVAGFSTACFHAIGPVLVGAKSGKKIGRGMAVFMVGGELGFGIGPLIVVAAVGALTLAGLPWLISIGLLCSIVLFFSLKNVSTVRPQHMEAPVPVGQVLKKMTPIMIPIAIYLFISGFLNANMVNFLPTFLHGEGQSLAFAGQAFSIVEIAGTFGVFMSGWLSDRTGQRVVIVASTLTMFVFSLLFLNTQGWLQVLMLVGLGLLAFSANPAFLAIVQRNFPENRSLANGIYMSTSFVVRSLSVLLVGVFGDMFGLRAVFMGSTWFLLLTLPFIFMIPRK